MSENTPELCRTQDYWTGRFSAMACPCEILIATEDENIARRAVDIGHQEALRIERKFSRYRDDNIIYAINHAHGKPIEVDTETANMLDFARQCYELSEGKFDITSGVLREIWKFDGSDNIPTEAEVNNILSRIGWHRVQWDNPCIQLEEDMEIDLGGIGKEYAVDQAARLIAQAVDLPILVNFGGDIFANSPRNGNTPWLIGVDNPERTGESSVGEIRLFRGGLATSGDARRYLVKNNTRYSHILNPITGWPIPDSPHSVTVISNTCLEAGMLSTFAMLQGTGARDFLQQQDVQYWCV